jgi:signal transduction histidine kinase
VHGATLDSLPNEDLPRAAVPLKRLGSSPGAGPHPEAFHTTQVVGDAAALEQAFLNLLLNAAQALEPGGRAQVGVTRELGDVTVIIRDEGRGIPKESAAKVFDLFYSTRPEGTGLGLSIARQIVQAHGGTIEIESTPGQGTTVRVTLPSAPAAATLV